MVNYPVAVISDLHSNLEALIAVLKDAKKKGVRQIYCLGDVIGYGPNPNEVMMLAEKFSFSLFGNHDEAVLSGKGLEYFNPIAEQAARWTRDNIFCPSVPKEISDKNKLFLQKMRRRIKVGNLIFAHGSIASNAEYIRSYGDGVDSFSRMENKNVIACFVGHTHRPCVLIEGISESISSDAEKSFPIEEKKKMIINVGSVGQPRDNNWKACYVIIEDNRVYFRRVEYDVEITQKKIYEIDRLNNFLGDRLKFKNEPKK
jgi:predicted phosphodiesterase